MTKSFKLFIALMAFVFIMPSSIIAMNQTEIDDEFNLKSLEDELRRLLEDQDEATPVVSESEQETITINPTDPDQDAETLEIEFNEPMTDAFKQEFKDQPKNAKEEVIILDEDDNDDFEEEDEE